MVALLCIASMAVGLSNAVSVGAKTVAATEGSSSKLPNPAREGDGCGCHAESPCHPGSLRAPSGLSGANILCKA